MADEFHPVSAEEAKLGYNPQNVSGKLVAIWSASIIAFLVLMFVLIEEYWAWYKFGEFHTKVEQAASEDLTALHAREDGELARYHYVDKAKGLVGLPISRAMELVAKGYAENKLTYPAEPINKAKQDALNTGAATGGAVAPAGAAPASAPNATAATPAPAAPGGAAVAPKNK